MTRRRSWGEGAIFQRAEGTWCGSVELEPGADGRRRRRWIYGRSRRDVLGKLDRLKAELQGGFEPAAPAQLRTTIGQLAAEWLEVEQAAGRRRPLSRVRIEVVVRHQILPYLGELHVSQLDADRIERWQAALLADGCAPRTVWKARGALAALIRAARRKRPPLLRDNPLELVDPPPAEPPQKRALTAEEAQRLLRALRGHRLEPLFLLLLILGLRRGEVLGLAWADVDLDARTLTVRQQVQRVPGEQGLHLVQPKSRAGTRVLPLPALLAERLRGMPRISPLVFCSSTGTPMEPRNLSRAFDALRRQAGIEAVTLHELRHSAATVMQVLLGIPPLTVAQLLGHADPAVTLRSYGHVVPEAHREAVDKMDGYVRRLGGV